MRCELVGAGRGGEVGGGGVKRSAWRAQRLSMARPGWGGGVGGGIGRQGGAGQGRTGRGDRRGGGGSKGQLGELKS